MGKSKDRTDRKDIYQRVTERIVADLEQDTRPWLKPWNTEHAARRISRPLRANGIPYKGINVLMLWSEAVAQGFAAPIWMTFKQAMELGAHVRKGEHGSLVVYASTLTRTETDDSTGEESEREIPFLLQYRFWPATLRAKQLIDEGHIGQITHFRAAYLHAGSVERQKPLNWKADAGRGGGVLADIGSHVLDLMQHLLGPLEPRHAVRRVWSRDRKSLHDPSRAIGQVGEDCILITMRTSDSAPGVIEAHKESGPGRVTSLASPANSCRETPAILTTCALIQRISPYNR
jgi:hypothetical protein